MIKKWKETAEYCLFMYGTHVDWEERFFICPNCAEPLYECDYAGEDFANCPVCEESFEN